MVSWDQWMAPDIALLVLSAAAVAYSLALPQTVETDWISYSSAPLLVCSSIFISQSLVSLVVCYILRSMKDLSEFWGHRLQRSLWLYMVMSITGSIMYFSKWSNSSHWIVNMTDAGGECFIMRNVHWLVSNPMQWFVYSQACTNCTLEDMTGIYKATVLLQIYGLLRLLTSDSRVRACMFTFSSCYYIQMFWLVYQLPLQRGMKLVAERIRDSTLIIWSIFPAVVLCRSFGLIGAWSEQVLLLSILDVIAKGLTFSAIIVSRVVLSLARINGTIQLVLSSHDVTVAVDRHFRLLDQPETLPMISAYFNDSEDRRLYDLCINEEHKQRLLEAARVADSQHLSDSTPKVVVAFRLPGGGGEMLAECFLSKCLHGRRIIGIAVQSQSGDPCEGDMLSMNTVQEESLEQTFMEDFSEISYSTSQSVARTPLNLQTALALHNCNDVLQLNEPLCKMLEKIFSQNLACAIFVSDDSPEASNSSTLVVASANIKAIFFPNGTMPQPLVNLLKGPTARDVVTASFQEEGLIHQWPRVETLNGAICQLTTMPLNRLSSVAATSNVKLTLLILEFVDHPPSYAMPGYLCWCTVGTRLVCTAPTAVQAVGSGYQTKVLGDVPAPSLLMPFVCAATAPAR